MADTILYINNDMRTILIPDNFVIGVVNDKLSHNIKFRLPRYYTGIDLSVDYNIFIMYTNPNDEDDMAIIEDGMFEVAETSIMFTWCPNRTAYVKEGNLQFVVSLVKTDIETGDVLSEFNTRRHYLYVQPGITLDNLIPEEVEKNILSQALTILRRADEACTQAETAARNSEESELAAKDSELAAKESELSAKEWDLKAESWAVGKRNGVDVPDSNETYHNNSKWYAELSRDKTIFGQNTITDAMNYVYPVGSIYMSMNNVSPEVLFGGTWERINSKFLFAAEDSGSYSVNKTGGSFTETLTTEQIPVHNHSFTGSNDNTSEVALTTGNPSTNTTGGTALTTSGSKNASNTANARTSTDNGGAYTIDGNNISTLSYGHTKDGYGSYPYEFNGNTPERINYTEGPVNITSGSSKVTTGDAGSHKHSYTDRTTQMYASDMGSANFTCDEGSQRVYPSTNSSSLLTESDGNHHHDMNHKHSLRHFHDIRHIHTIPNHTHGMEHKHTIDSHTHTLSHTHNIANHKHTYTPSGSIGNTGGGNSHNNMPPYLTVYMWKRLTLAPWNILGNETNEEPETPENPTPEEPNND